MINFNDVTRKNKQDHNPHWPQTPDHPFRILVVGGCVSTGMSIPILKSV